MNGYIQYLRNTVCSSYYYYMNFVCITTLLADKVQKPGKVYVKHKRHIIKFSDAWAGQHVTFGKQRDTCEIYAWGLNNYYQLGK